MKVEGWVVALGQTIIVYTLLVCGFFIDSILKAWPIMGPYVQTIFPLTLGSWFAYKTITKLGGNGKNGNGSNG